MTSVTVDTIPEGRTRDYYHRKANQHWDMAGLARQDCDHKDEQRHTELARAYDQKAREAS